MWKYFSFLKGYNLLYNLRRTVQINNSLVDAHLKAIPSFWTFTTRSLTCCDTEDLSWHSNRTLHTKILFLCSINQISTNCKEKGKRISCKMNDLQQVHCSGLLHFGPACILHSTVLWKYIIYLNTISSSITSGHISVINLNAAKIPYSSLYRQ
jgi:hypothetical protein